MAYQTVKFAPGLNAITGESGSGKSVLIEALGQLLGNPAPPECVRTPATSAVLEGNIVLSPAAARRVAAAGAALGLPERALPAVNGSLPARLVLKREVRGRCRPLPAAGAARSACELIAAAACKPPHFPLWDTTNHARFPLPPPPDLPDFLPPQQIKSQTNQPQITTLSVDEEHAAHDAPPDDSAHAGGSTAPAPAAAASGELRALRSRCYVNGAITSLRVLRALGAELFDTNGQHAAIGLRDSDTQLALLDRIAGRAGLLRFRRLQPAPWGLLHPVWCLHDPCYCRRRHLLSARLTLAAASVAPPSSLLHTRPRSPRRAHKSPPNRTPPRAPRQLGARRVRRVAPGAALRSARAAARPRRAGRRGRARARIKAGCACQQGGHRAGCAGRWDAGGAGAPGAPGLRAASVRRLPCPGRCLPGQCAGLGRCTLLWGLAQAARPSLSLAHHRCRRRGAPAARAAAVHGGAPLVARDGARGWPSTN